MITTLGTRLNNNRADIEEFDLGNLDIEILNFKKTFLINKIFNLLIRMSTSKNSSKKVLFFKTNVELVSRLFFIFHFKKCVDLDISKGISGVEAPKSKKSVVHIGYFQNVNVLNSTRVMDNLRNMSLRNRSSEVFKFSTEAKIQNPIIVHVRLGDYLKEKDFINLGLDYYNQALEYLIKEPGKNKIWLFSDNPELAINFLPMKYHHLVRVLEIPTADATLTFEVMKLGSAYVIANSTFSWWSAILRKDMQATVVAPSQWFVNYDSNRHLIPPEWKII